ncbi:hypothetical protein BOX15_Mlig020593g3 [Macrostomum lignano]|uniref:Uncharacterized protein n=1 Tax=Macrostomum lignano TaxID=282301 RepID=A0A267DB84_9PLAT|nr:hypothetical protein BOX15_Mlig020593g3 [Macrostomum lignano]
MEPLMQLVVPELDGGVLRPLFDTMLQQGVNATDDVECSAKASTVSQNRSFCEQNVTYVDLGKPLLAWYLQRLKSQVPLFVSAGLIWLILLAALIAVYSRLARTTKVHEAHRSNSPVERKHLRPLFVFLTSIVLLIVIGVVLAVLHWAGRARFSGMSDLGGCRNGTKDCGDDQQQRQLWNLSSGTGRTHMVAAFRRTIDEFDAFVEQFIVETNATVLAVCKEALPEVLAVLQTVATDLLDRLARDFKLTPLLTSFDEFINLVKLLVASMRAIMESRDTVVEPLVQFSTLVDSARRDLQELTTDACASNASSAPTSAATADLCRRISAQLNLLDVGIDQRRLKSDSSVTVVTLLEKMFKLNFSQVEDQVKNAKGQLYGSLELVRAEVRKLFDKLTLEVSQNFNAALTDAELFRDGVRGAKKDRGFLDAMKTVDSLVHSFTVALAFGSVAFVIINVIAMFISIRYLLSFRGISSDSTDGGTDGEQIPLQYIGNGNSAPVANGNGRCIELPFLQNSDIVRVDQRQKAKEPRDWHLVCLFASGLLVLAALIYASAVFYAGAETQMDACRYLTTETGISYLDQRVYSAMINRLWPLVEALMPNHLIDYLGFSSDLMPRELLSTIVSRCGNDSVTIFQALGLSSAGAVVNASQLLRAPFVTRELSKGGEMIQDLVRDLDTNNLIPAEVDDLLKNTLPNFASAIDSENFASSILELNKPLLLLSAADFRSLRRHLSRLEDNLRRANSTDRRPDLINYMAHKTERNIDRWNRTLIAGLKFLLGNFTTLQTNRRLTNLTFSLTVDALNLKKTLANKYFLLRSIARRYNETLFEHMSMIAELGNSLISRLLNRVGRCGPLRDIFQISVKWCQVQIEPLPETGIYLMASCIAFYIMVHLMLCLMYRMRTKTEVYS